MNPIVNMELVVENVKALRGIVKMNHLRGYSRLRKDQLVER